MSRLNKLSALAAAVALSGGLAACGGGGGSTDESMMQTPQEMCADAGGRYNADGSCTSAEALEVERLQGLIADLRQQLGIDDTADPSATIADLQMELEDLQEQLREINEEKETADAKAAAAAARALFAGIGDTTNFVFTLEQITVADEYGGGMASFTIESGATTPLAPGVAGDDTMKSAEPMLGPVWQGTMLTDAIAADATTNPGASTTVVVYTDIAKPKPVPFGDVHALDGDVLRLNADADADAHVGLISSNGSEFKHTGRMDHDPDPESATDVVRVRGMFNGAMGEYRCTAATPTTCASIESSAGVRLVGADGSATSAWIFDPDSEAKAMMADPHFAYFGWWLNKGTADEGVEAGVFHGVTDATATEDQTLAAPTDISALGDTATYSGSAAGKYAIQPSLSAASGGHWTAEATLTADWGTETAAGTISGMVNNFMAGGEMMEWSVALGETPLSATGAFDTSDDTNGNMVVWTIGGVDGAEAGNWSGGLRAAGDNGVPTLATGSFMGTHGSVGHILGAFGAHLDE